MSDVNTKHVFIISSNCEEREWLKTLCRLMRRTRYVAESLDIARGVARRVDSRSPPVGLVLVACQLSDGTSSEFYTHCAQERLLQDAEWMFLSQEPAPQPFDFGRRVLSRPMDSIEEVARLIRNATQ